MSTSTQVECRHFNFQGDFSVGRILENEGDECPSGYTANITIKCVDCGEPFVFLGLSGGYSPSEPMRDFNGTEARMPIVPQSELAMLMQELAQA